MELIFENELGAVTMTGGGDGDIRITALSGLSIPEVERRTFSSYDFDGAVESGRKIPPRSIIIGGDITGTPRQASTLLKLLYKPCTMTVIAEDLRRSISVNSAKLELDRKNMSYTKFALALVCDDPYFYDADETTVGLYEKENLITDQTVLPAVFSRRVQQAEIIPVGDAEVEAKYIISGTASDDTSEGEIVISNLTTGKDFILSYIPSEGELITIDMTKRTISSNKSGNLIEYISDESFLSDLVIDQGGSELYITGYGSASEIAAYLIYRNKYIEAAL